jgi:type II secretory pathway pseudopilin PulG
MGFTPPPPAQPRQGLAIASLVIGILSLPTLGCLGLGAVLSIVLGIMALVRAGRDPREYGGRGFAIGGIVASAISLVVAIPLVGIVAAIAIPSLLRARVSANEAATIGDVRTVISAQAAYGSANCDTYGRLECLSNPRGTGCLVDYPATAPTFLDSTLTSAQVKSGYRRTFHPGAEVALARRPGCAGGTGLASFAYTAEPATRGQTGVRGFCGDDSGQICFTTDGSAPPVTNSRCAEGCTPLR